MAVRIRPVEARDADVWLRMRIALLGARHARELAGEVRSSCAGAVRSCLPLATLVAEERGRLLGYVEVGLRSHAGGCDPLRPVGYLEEWFVLPEARRRGVGRALLRAAEHWARGHGCTEMASDARSSSRVARSVHAALGFEAADDGPIVPFRKPLRPGGSRRRANGPGTRRPDARGPRRRRPGKP